MYLSLIEQDALAELLNIGIRRSAVALSQMLATRVDVTSPAVELLTTARFAALIGEDEEPSVAVIHDIRGAFSGHAFLIMTTEGSNAIAAAMLQPQDRVDLSGDALRELGNVVLNQCLGTMANMLERTVDLGLPSLSAGHLHRIISSKITAPSAAVLLLQVRFHARDLYASGRVALVMDDRSMADLKTLIHNYLARRTSAAQSKPAHLSGC